MTKITNTRDLNAAILRLRQSRKSEWLSLKKEYLNTCEKITVPNLIKSALTSAQGPADLKTGFISTALGITSGIIAKKLVVGKTINPFSRMLGVILEVLVAHKVTENSAGIKEMGNRFLEKITGPAKPAEKT